MKRKEKKRKIISHHFTGPTTLHLEKYPYSNDLKEIERMVSPIPLDKVPPALLAVNTPVVLKEWERQLSCHPDPYLASYLVNGFGHGFRIGFNCYQSTCKSAKVNMQTAKQNAEVVEERLQAEESLKQVIGPLPVDQYPQVQISRFGVIPKNHQPGKWRMIVNLSHPKQSSVNDKISANLCSLKYASVDNAIQTIL